MLSFRIGEFLGPGCFSGTHACVEFRNIRHTATRQENRVEKIVRKVYGYANQVSYISGAATFPLLAAKAGCAARRQANAEEGPCTGLRNRFSRAIRWIHITAEEDPCI